MGFAHRFMEPDAVLVISAVISSYVFLCTRLFYSPSEHTYNLFLAIPIFRISSFSKRNYNNTEYFKLIFVTSMSEKTRLITEKIIKIHSSPKCK